MQRLQRKIPIWAIVVISLLLILSGLILSINATVSAYNESFRAEFLRVLSEQEGNYNEEVLIFDNVDVARRVAKKYDVKIRTSGDDFATVNLPDFNVKSFALDKTNAEFLPYVQLDYNVSLSEIDYEIVENDTSLNALILDKYYKEQTHFNYLNMGSVWNTTKGKNSNGERVRVAIIDSGIDTDHVEFYTSSGASVISNLSYNASEDKVVSEAGLEVIEDTQGHGTAVAGVIASQINLKGVVGIAPDVELLVIKCNVDDKGVFVSSADIVYAIDYAVENGADVINMSFGSPSKNTAQVKALQKAVENNIIPVAATGNDAVRNATYPACLDSTIGVGALTQDSWEIADYSNYGLINTDVVAPGTTLTAYLDDQIAYTGGTSFASPIVAGACALYIAKNGTTDFETLKQNLLLSCKDLGESGVDEYYGYGAIDINAFVNASTSEITYEYNNEKVDNVTSKYVKNNTMKTAPTYPEIDEYAVENWYFDEDFTSVLEYEKLYTHVFTSERALYAKWSRVSQLFVEGVEADFSYEDVENGVSITAYNGNERYIIAPQTLGGKTVVQIGASAFANNERLTRIILPNTLTSIGEKAFENCTALNEIRIPASVVQIGDDAFLGCSALNTIYLSSSTVLGAFEGASENGGLTAFANNIAVDKNLQASQKLIDLYPHVEEIEDGGINYVLYSKCEHVWRKVDTLQERVACSKDGIYLYKCDCGARKTILEYAHVKGDWKVVIEAKCEENGRKIKECTLCFVELESDSIAMLGHDKIYHDGQDATCEDDGWNAYETCTRCDYSTYEKISAHGHSEAVINGYAPSCSSTGLSDGKYCSTCYKELEKQEVIPKLDHIESDWITDSEPKCEENGSKHKECTVCHETLVTESIPKLEHDYEYLCTIEPNWEEQKDGYDVYVCQNDESHKEHRNVTSWENLSVTISVEGGLVNGESVAVVKNGTTVTITAQPDEGMKLDYWEIDGVNVGDDDELVYTATSSVTVVAVYKKKPLISCERNAKEMLLMVSILSIVALAIKKILTK